jgi:hypothetical protein
MIVAGTSRLKCVWSWVLMEGKKHVLVIGGTQFMGRVLVERILAQGGQVTLINR